MGRAVKQPTETIAVSVVVNVPRETLNSALESGDITGPHGYAYWCSYVGCVSASGAKYPKGDSDRLGWLLRGNALRVTEYDETTGDETHHTMALKGFLKGFAQWAIEWGVKGERDAETGAVDFEIDAPASDAILQYAVFGEQKYG